jgi:hypothetical protein
VSGDEAANIVVDPAVRRSGSARPRQRGIGFLSAAADIEAAAKLKGGLDVEWDRHRLTLSADVPPEAARGLPPSLVLDANESWSPKQAVRHAAEFERTLDLTWVEEPVRRWDAEGLAVSNAASPPRRDVRAELHRQRAAGPPAAGRPLPGRGRDRRITPTQRAGPRLLPVTDDGWTSRQSRLNSPRPV